MTEEAAKAAAGELGWWGTYILTVQNALLAFHDYLLSRGVPYPYGI